jgi:hypothetical protein
MHNLTQQEHIMSTITIKLAPTHLLGQFFFSDCTDLASRHLPFYTVCDAITVSKAGRDAAEEAFDLTNNPSREDERARLYGARRSVSVGDVVEVDGVDYLCDSFGWAVI